MAKKQKTTTTSGTSIGNNSGFVKFCSFWGIVIAVALLIVTAIFNAVGGNLGIVGTIFDVLAKLALLIAVSIPAYNYTRGKKIGWKVTYWVALILYIVCIVLGAIPWNK